VRDAREHGDVNRSQWDCTLEKTDALYRAVRLGFCMVRSLKQKDAEQLVDRRTYDRFARVYRLQVWLVNLGSRPSRLLPPCLASSPRPAVSGNTFARPDTVLTTLHRERLTGRGRKRLSPA
jgi:hypothetical protein